MLHILSIWVHSRLSSDTYLQQKPHQIQKRASKLVAEMFCFLNISDQFLITFVNQLLISYLRQKYKQPFIYKILQLCYIVCLPDQHGTQCFLMRQLLILQTEASHSVFEACSSKKIQIKGEKDINIVAYIFFFFIHYGSALLFAL